MISVNCSNCINHCCGYNPLLTPVLLPSEEERFKDYSTKVVTPHREMFMLKKGEDENCIFLDNVTIRCNIYEQRPLECMLYPFLLDFSNGKARVKLDERFCPNLKTLEFNMDKINTILNKHEFPEDWIKGYIHLENC